MGSRSVVILAIAKEHYKPSSIAKIKLLAKDKPDHTKLFIFSRKQLLGEKNSTTFTATYHFFSKIWGRVVSYILMCTILAIQLPTYVIVLSQEDRELFKHVQHLLFLITGTMKVLTLEDFAETKEYKTLLLHPNGTPVLLPTTQQAEIVSLAEEIKGWFMLKETLHTIIDKIKISDCLIITTFQTGLLNMIFYLSAVFMNKTLLIYLTDDQAYRIAAQRRLPFFWEIIQGLNPFILLKMTVVNRSLFIVPTYKAKVELVRSYILEGAVSVIADVYTPKGEADYKRLIQSLSWPYKNTLKKH